jgi:hypothetical protein
MSSRCQTAVRSVKFVSASDSNAFFNAIYGGTTPDNCGRLYGNAISHVACIMASSDVANNHFIFQLNNENALAFSARDIVPISGVLPEREFYDVKVFQKNIENELPKLICAEQVAIATEALRATNKDQAKLCKVKLFVLSHLVKVHGETAATCQASKDWQFRLWQAFLCDLDRASLWQISAEMVAEKFLRRLEVGKKKRA